MGTNFYHEPLVGEVCSHCGRGDHADLVHIGKSSAGWQFSFHATDEIRSAAAWFTALERGKISDEYGLQWSLTDFRNMVERKRTDPHHHAREYPAHGFTDPEGYSFSDGEFS